ncbi:MAG: hypothetical protein KC912_25130 [Proteobacteria bacterium]|nr:hypothetical protein [Pseudomonadota bacterium]
MRDSKKKGQGPTTSGVDRAANASMKDPRSAQMKSAGTAVGNDTIQKRLSQGANSRDELLQFLTQRLGTMRQVQLRELGLLDARSMAQNKGAIADEQKHGVTAPAPERWGESARLYEEAAIHLCRGSLARGTALIQQAVAAEQRAFDTMTTLVSLADIDADQGVAPGEPPVTAADLDVSATAACDMPEGVQVARDIQNVVAETPNITWRKRARDPWWTLDEEEEEEEAADGGAG